MSSMLGCWGVNYTPLRHFAEVDENFIEGIVFQKFVISTLFSHNYNINLMR